MCDVWFMGRRECGKSGMRDVFDMTCLGCGILVMWYVWNVWNVGFSKCGVLCAVWNI